MNIASAEARLLKGLLQVILDADFTAEEARAAAKSLREGKLLAPVAHLLDVLGTSLAHSTDSTINSPNITDLPPPSMKKTSQAIRPSIDEVFNNVKRRKITKANLFEMFDAVNGSVASGISDTISVREALTAFKSLISDSDWTTLNKIVLGTIDFDPFLRGMLK